MSKIRNTISTVMLQERRFSAIRNQIDYVRLLVIPLSFRSYLLNSRELIFLKAQAKIIKKIGDFILAY